jgi:hypothetical protein
MPMLLLGIVVGALLCTQASTAACSAALLTAAIICVLAILR